VNSSERPDVLVLGVGGVLGEAWMSGFLAGAEEATGVDFRDVDAFIGTSAGSIVAASLAAGVGPRRPGSRGAGPDEPASAVSAGAVRGGLGRVGRLYLNAFSPLAAPALSAAVPGGRFTRAAVLSRLPRGTLSLDDLRTRVAALAPRFDGRLRIVAVDRRAGRRVVFGAPGAPPATVADAVAASCAVPAVFRPVQIGGREYVDGGVWSPTNIDAAQIGRGDRVLCLVPSAALGASPRLALRGLSAGMQLATTLEATAARRRGATVTIVAPDARAATAIGANPMDPRPREQVLAEGFRQGRERSRAPASPRT
jgi:NTE family protein